jgi:hypothetical protein
MSARSAAMIPTMQVQVSDLIQTIGGAKGRSNALCARAERIAGSRPDRQTHRFVLETRSTIWRRREIHRRGQATMVGRSTGARPRRSAERKSAIKGRGRQRRRRAS